MPSAHFIYSATIASGCEGVRMPEVVQPMVAGLHQAHPPSASISTPTQTTPTQTATTSFDRISTVSEHSTASSCLLPSALFRYVKQSKYVCNVFRYFQFSTCVRQRDRRRCAKSGNMVFALGGFLIACIALWSTIRAMEDGRKAVSLAEWTARKDFFEYCHSTGYKEDSCDKIKTTSLGPPPLSGMRLKARMLQQTVTKRFDTFPGSLVILAGFPLMMSVWVSSRKALGKPFRNRPCSNPVILQYELGLLATTDRAQFIQTNRKVLVPRSRKPLALTTGKQVTPALTVSPLDGISGSFNFSLPAGVAVGKSFDFEHPPDPLQNNLGASSALQKGIHNPTHRRKTRNQSSLATVPVALTPKSQLLLSLAPCQICSSKLDPIVSDELLTYYPEHKKSHFAAWCWPCSAKVVRSQLALDSYLTCGHMTCGKPPPKGLHEDIGSFLMESEQESETLDRGGGKCESAGASIVKRNWNLYGHTSYDAQLIRTGTYMGRKGKGASWFNVGGGVICRWDYY
ncbi:hypothetical protein QC762_601038 [Podospora pseudocomata]|uniref:Uncharacterized protein n=1 Tax=Podospora pseudocomata TaxID=2093779 RepID=A0ABR0G7V5_9PEZI|nr:hypothetical protein QC762_601038 [Podospora pseudocomata]